MKMRLLAAILGLVGTTLAWSAPVGADPSGGRSFELPLDCGSAGTFRIVVFSNGTWSPGLDVASNSVLVPYRISETGTFFPGDGSDPVPVFSDVHEKGTPRNKAPRAECSFTAEFPDAGGTFVVEGQATVFITPAKP